jgi:membrane fusion protein (multidrug efflux system)
LIADPILKRLKRFRTPTILLACIFAVLAGWLYVHTASKVEPSAKALTTKSVFDPKRYRIGHVRPRDFELWASIPGEAHAFRKAVIYAHVPGYLKYLNVDKGDTVRRGQVLAYIYDPEIYQHYQRDLAEAEIAHITFLRKRAVWKEDHRVISLENVQRSEAEWKEKQAKADYEKVFVRYKTLVAPFDGIITRRFIDPWNLVSTGTGTTEHAMPVLKESYVDMIRVYVGVPEKFVRFVKRGQLAWIDVQGLPGQKFYGRITRFNYALNPQTRTMRTEIDLFNSSHKIYPGMYVRAHILLKTYRNTLSVHHMAVVEGRHGDFVYLLRGGKRIRVPVVAGVRNGDFVQILHGLDENDTVLVKLYKTIF